MKEEKLLKNIYKIFNYDDKKIVCGVGDDCAVIDLGDKEYFYLFSSDDMVEKTHFILDFLTPQEIASKLVRMNVSDVLAMGNSYPLYAMVNGGLHFKKIDDKWIILFLKALKKELEFFGIKNIGGNLSKSKDVFFSMKIIGKVKKDGVVYRKGAKEGDFLCIYGFCGTSMASVEIMKNKKRKDITEIEKDIIRNFSNPILYPDFIRKNYKYFSCMIDNSDGIYKTSLILSEVNKLKIVIDYNLMKGVVKDVLLRWSYLNKKNPFDFALFGGEDYNPIFAVSKQNLRYIDDMNVKIIGRFEKGFGVEVLNYNGKIKKFEHF